MGIFSSKKTFCLPLFLFIFILGFSKYAEARTATWDGEGADNNWSTAENWDTDVAPTSGDHVVFDATSTKNCTINTTITTNNFTIDSGYSGTISASSGNNITINGEFNQAAGSLALNDGNFTLNSNFTVSGGTSTLGSTAPTFQGAVTVSGTGTVDASNASLTAITFNYTFNMASGTPTWTIKSGATYTFKHGVTLTAGTIDTSNLNAVFSAASDAGLDVDTSATFNNIEINKPGAWGFSTNDTINVAGTLTLTSGSFQGSGKLVTTGGTIAETFQGGSGKVEITSGTVTVATYATGVPYMKVNGGTLTGFASGTSTFNKLDVISGTFSPGAGNITITNDYTQSGGTATLGSGTPTFTNNFYVTGGTLTFGSGVPSFLSNVYVSGTGTVDASNAALTSLSFPGQFKVYDSDPTSNPGSEPNETPTWTSKSGATYTLSGGINYTAGTFTNLSNLNLSFIGDSGDFEISADQTVHNFTVNKNATWAVAVSNQTVTVSGTLSLINGTVSSGNILTSGGSASDTFDGGSAVVSIESGTFTINNSDGVTTNLPKMKVNGGTLTGMTTGTSTFNQIDVVSGTLSIGSSIINVTNNYTQTGGTATFGAGASTFNGTFQVNAGTLTFGSGAPAFIGTVTLAGTGTVDASNAALTAITFGYPFDMSSGTPTWIAKNGATYTYNHNFTFTAGTFTNIANLNVVMGAAVDVSIDVDTSVTVNNFEVNKPGGWVVSLSGDTLIVNGTLTLTDGRLNSGTVTAKGNISFGGTGGTPPNFDGGNATLQLTGASSQTITINAGGGTWPSGLVTINKTNNTDTVTVSGGALTLNASGQSLTITKGILDLATNDLTVNDTFTISTNGNLQLAGAQSISAGTLTNNGTVTYNGNSNATIKNWDYVNLVINSGMAGTTFSFPANKNITGDLTIASGALKTDGFDITVGGTFSNTDTLQINGDEQCTLTMDTDSGTVELIGSGTYSSLPCGYTYKNLTFNHSGSTWTQTSSLNLNGNLTITSGTLDSNGQNISLAGNWSNAGSYVSGANAVILNGTGDQSIVTGGTSNTQDFNNFYIAKIGGTATLTTNNIDIDGTFMLTTGTFNANGLAMTVSGNWENTATFTHGNGTVNLGEGSQSIIGSTTFYNLTKSISSAATLTLTAGTTQTVSHSLTINGASGQLLTIASSAASAATLNASSTTASYVSVSYNTASTGIDCFTGCVNSGHNSGWHFYAQPSVTLSLSSPSFSENAGTTNVIATLSGIYDDTVTVDLSFSGSATFPGNYLRSGTSIAVTAGQTTGSVTLTGVDNSLDASTKTVIVDISNVSNGTESGTQQVTANLTDDDATPTLSIANLTVNENVGTATMTVSMTSYSESSVTVDYATSDATATAGNDYTATSGTLTWTSGQTGDKTFDVTITNDAFAEANETFTLTLSNPSSATISSSSATLTLNDNDTRGITITESGTTDITEGGATDTYTVVLTSEPRSNVAVLLTPDSQQTVSPTSLTFTSANWSTPQTVTVTAVDDQVAEASHTGSIAQASSSTDTGTYGYDALTLSAITTHITDNDSAGITLTQSGGNTSATEGGVTDTYSLVLTTQPTHDVLITPSFNSSQITVTPASLTFTSANWSTPQSFTVTATDDEIAEGNHTSQITHTVTSSDTHYNNASLASVDVSLVDNDSAGVSLVESDGNTSVSVDSSDTYTVALTSKPTADVVITVSAGAGISTSPTALTFTTTNWETPQTITVSTQEDSLSLGIQNATLSHSAESMDAHYQGLIINSVTASIVEQSSAGTSGSAGSDNSAGSSGSGGTAGTSENTAGSTGSAGTAGTSSTPSLTANAGPDLTLTSGGSVTLDGSVSTGSISSYKWAILSGEGSITNDSSATASFSIPATALTQNIEVSLTVSNDSSSSTDTCLIQVIAAPSVEREAIDSTLIAHNEETAVYERKSIDSSGQERTTLQLPNSQVQLPKTTRRYSFALTRGGIVVIGVYNLDGSRGRTYFSRLSIEQLAGTIDLEELVANSQSAITLDASVSLTPAVSSSTNFAASTGLSEGDEFGKYIAAADLDMDGTDEILISAPNANQHGELYIYNESQELLGTITGSADHPIKSMIVGNFLSRTKPDILFGPDNLTLNTNLARQATLTTSALSQAANFLVADLTNFNTNINLASHPIDAQIGINTTSIYQSFALGDVNGDSKNDLVATDNAGSAYIFLGRDTIANLNLADANVHISGGSASEGFGLSLNIGDVTGDGIADIVIGSPLAGARTQGALTVIYGQRTWPSTLNLTTSTSALTIHGSNPNDSIGGDNLLNDSNQDGRLEIYTTLGDSNVMKFDIGAQGVQSTTEATTIEGGGYSVGSSNSAFGCSLIPEE